MTSINKSMTLNILKIVLSVLGALFVVLAVVELPADLKSLTVEDQEAAMNNGKLGLMTTFTLFIVILGAILILGFFLVGLITDTKKTLKAVLGYALAGVAFLLFYAMAKGTVTPVAVKDGIAASTLKATEAGLYLTIFMVIVGFALMLVGPLFRYIKK
jgi:hypothetical protein